MRWTKAALGNLGSSQGSWRRNGHISKMLSGSVDYKEDNRTGRCCRGGCYTLDWGGGGQRRPPAEGWNVSRTLEEGGNWPRLLGGKLVLGAGAAAAQA